MKISGTFDVNLQPLAFEISGLGGVKLGRMAIEKQFHGELDATSSGEMLSAITPVEGSAGYVALEQVTGTLCGKTGSFVLQHFGTMTKGQNHLVLEVVPDSGAEELSGLSGTMQIRAESGHHYYEFEFDFG